MSEAIINVKELRKLVSESSNEFKAVIGKGVEDENKKNSGKACSDANKRAKDYDGGLENEVGYNEIKYEKDDGNYTLLDYNPENASKEWKNRTKANALGYSSEAEMNNGLPKSGNYSGNKKFYDGIKACGKKMHKNVKDFKETGLQASKMPDKTFEKEEMYESKIIEHAGLIVPYAIVKMIFDMAESGETTLGLEKTPYDEIFDNMERHGEIDRNMLSKDKAILSFISSAYSEASKKFGDDKNLYESKDGVNMRNLINKFNSYSNEENNSLNEENLKTIFFKKTAFLTEGHMISRIPDEFKKDGNQFKMKDKTGNEYIVEWKNGKGNIIGHNNKSGLIESIDRMKNLYNYSSSDSKTTLSERMNEGENSFSRTLKAARRIIK